MKEVNASTCGREDSLIAFLYGELGENESRDFRRHMYDCATCTEELASFANVRESVVAWRDESLGRVAVPAFSAKRAAEKPSAWAAVRQFLNLSPLWMKGALACAAILFCLFAGLAIARLRQTAPTVIVAGSHGSEEQIKAQVEQRLQAEVDRRVKQELERLQTSPKAPVSNDAFAQKVSGQPRRNFSNSPNVAGNNPNQKARRPLSKTEREQLAADLRLVSARNDNDLDLLDDGINQ